MTRLEEYARLVLRVGVGLRPGQTLLVNARVEHAPLAAAVAEEAWKAGAGEVDVVLDAPVVRRARVAFAPEAALEHTHGWRLARVREANETGAAVVSISAGSDDALYAGLDPSRLGRTRPRAYVKEWIRGVDEKLVSWCIVGAPTPTWAAEVFGEPDTERLWDAIGRAMRLDAPDPAAAWDERLGQLERRAADLSDRDLRGLRFRGPGTDLTIGLIPGHRWVAGRLETTRGQRHAPNLPTEEVFTSPDPRATEGTVRTTKPFGLSGARVEGLELTFRGGEIVGVRADRGQEVVEEELRRDAGARRLGEVALVDSSSGVAATGVLFNNTLFDENAASHIAWGAGFPWTVEGLGDEERALVNVSETHNDVMVGSPEVEVDGLDAAGAAVPLLRDGRWQLPE